MTDRREAQNDWRDDPQNPEKMLRRLGAIGTRKTSSVPPDIVNLIENENSRLKVWLLSMGISPAEYRGVMMELAQKAVDLSRQC